MRYDFLTRLFHIVVAVGITSQLATSVVMVPPKPNVIPNEWFGVHAGTGSLLLFAISAYWLWIIGRTVVRGESMRLFPWLSFRLLADLKADIGETARAVAHLRLPSGGDPRPLPAAIQGLGLLMGLTMAATGTLMDAASIPGSELWPYFFKAKAVHEAIAPLIWLYLLAHPLLGILHQLAGHGSLTRMFWFSKKV